MDKVRIGFVGAGGIVRTRHLPNLKLLPQVELAAVCNQHRATAETIARDFGIKDVIGDWRELVARPNLDVIWIGTPPYMHAEVTIAALKAGKHVFCQARMAMNLSQAREMLAESKTHPGQVTMLCPAPHGLKGGRVVERLLREKAIGQPLHFHLQAFNDSWADPAHPAHWRQKAELSGQNILTVGIYAEVVGRWLGFPLELAAVHHVYYPQRQGYEVRIPDWIAVAGRWPGDLFGTMEWSGVARASGHERLDIFGSEGRLLYDFNDEKIFIARAGEKSVHELPVRSDEQGEWTVEKDFIAAVERGGKPEPGFETGVKYMEFLDKIWSAPLPVGSAQR
jgi:predicted dehydrogenase